MRFLSLFSGIGGFDLGLERAGWTCVGQVEIDPFCNLVLEKHWPNMPRWSDVRTVDLAWLRGLGPIDAIVGGSPCQDISCAGKGVGITGERSGLWFEFLWLVQEVRPAWVLAENVPALRTRGADTVLEGLAEAGYACWPLVVGAEDVGAPHRRKRVWIVAYRLGDSLRDEPGRSGGESRTGEAEPGGHGEALADIDRTGQHPKRLGTVLDGEWKASGNNIDGCDKRVVGCDGASWPARPGEPQHDWEEPRLAQLPVGGAAHGLPERLVRRANQEALRAYGNAIVPQVAEVIGRAINRSALPWEREARDDDPQRSLFGVAP